MKKSIILPAVALLALGVQQANAYDAEVGITYGFGDIEAGSADADTTAYGIGGEFYFGGVDDSSGPLAEAPFVDRASSIFASYSNTEIDFDFGDTDTDSYTLGGRYVDKASGWLVGGSYSNTDNDDTDTDTLSFEVGKYVADYTTVTFQYSLSDSDDNDTDAYGVEVEHLAELGGESFLAIDGFIGTTQPDEGDDVFTLAGGVTYYVNTTLGFGTSYQLDDADDSEITTVAFFATWFPAPNVELVASYSYAEEDELDIEIDMINLGAALRF